MSGGAEYETYESYAYEEVTSPGPSDTAPRHQGNLPGLQTKNGPDCPGPARPTEAKDELYRKTADWKEPNGEAWKIAISIVFLLISVCMAATCLVLALKVKNEISLRETDFSAKVAEFEDKVAKHKHRMTFQSLALGGKISNASAKILKTGVKVSGWHIGRNHHLYQLSKFKLNYTFAKKECEKLGATLATTGIRDELTRREIQTHLTETSPFTWIGLEKNGNEEWIWIDGVRSHGNESYWHPGEPNIAGREYCAEIKYYRNLNDNECNLVGYFLCEA